MITTAAVRAAAHCAALSIALAWVSAAAQDRLGPAGNASLRPDLVIVDAQVAPANPTRLRVRVANRGLAPAAETLIQIYCDTDDGPVTQIAAVPMLRAGERHWFVLEASVPLDRLRGVTLEIDVPSRVIESDEANNRFVYR